MSKRIAFLYIENTDEFKVLHMALEDFVKGESPRAAAASVNDNKAARALLDRLNQTKGFRRG